MCVWGAFRQKLGAKCPGPCGVKHWRLPYMTHTRHGGVQHNTLGGGGSIHHHTHQLIRSEGRKVRSLSVFFYTCTMWSGDLI